MSEPEQIGTALEKHASRAMLCANGGAMVLIAARRENVGTNSRVVPSQLYLLIN